MNKLYTLLLGCGLMSCAIGCPPADKPAPPASTAPKTDTAPIATEAPKETPPATTPPAVESGSSENATDKPSAAPEVPETDVKLE